MSRWIVIGLTLLAIVGCGDSGDSTGSGESERTAPEQATRTAEAAQVVEEVAEDVAPLAKGTQVTALAKGTVDLAGLSVNVSDDGTIRLSGADRWGGRIDTTYQNVEYLSNAIPVLKRSLTDEQGGALDAFVGELSGEAENTPKEASGGEGEG